MYWCSFARGRFLSDTAHFIISKEVFPPFQNLIYICTDVLCISWFVLCAVSTDICCCCNNLFCIHIDWDQIWSHAECKSGMAVIYFRVLLFYIDDSVLIYLRLPVFINRIYESWNSWGIKLLCLESCHCQLIIWQSQMQHYWWHGPE